MFGIELDKLLFVGILIGLIVGPTRLRAWRRKLPQMVGRVHALYQQGRAQVTRDLDDMAPEWREYDPRQLDPRRILREFGADVRNAAEIDGARVGSGKLPGESPVEPETGAADEQGGREPAGVEGDNVETPALAAPSGKPSSDRDHRNNDPRAGEGGAATPRPTTSESRPDEDEVPQGVHVARVGGRGRAGHEEEPVEQPWPPQDGRGGGEGERRAADGEPREDGDGSAASGRLGGRRPAGS